METMTVKAFRSNMAEAFNRAAAGEKVTVRRRNQLYTIIPIEKEYPALTEEQEMLLQEAEAEYKRGECIKCDTLEELDAYFKGAGDVQD